MTLAAPTARVLPSPAEMIDAVFNSPDGRVAYHGVPWSAYEALLEEIGDGLPRVSFDNGVMELYMPDKEHEACEWSAVRFVEAYMDENEIEYEPMAHTTLRDQPQGGGLEADSAYYVQNFAAIAGRPVDLSVDPPPDLAIEIDISPPSPHKAAIYARLGVPEIWRWRGGRITILERRVDEATGERGYAERAKSLALPDFPFDRLTAELLRLPHPHQVKAVREFRRWCQQQAAK